MQYNESENWFPLLAALTCGALGAGSGAGAAFLIPTGPIDWTWFLVYLLAGVGFIIGVPLGYVAGAFWSNYIDTEIVDAHAKMESQGPQLVGESCVICGNTISSILEGEFCPECHNPVQFKCTDGQVHAFAERNTAATCCPRCGT